MPLAALKTVGFKWAIFWGKKFAIKNIEGSLAATGATHCWPHIFSNDGR